jgi:hypothetical protein
MKITKSQLKNTLTILKQMETKDQIIVLEIKDNVLNIHTRRDGLVLKLKAIKTEEKESELIAIKKEFLTKIEKQDAEEFELKINKKTISSKVNGISFSTAIMVEEMNFEVKEEEIEATKIMITTEVMKTLDNALSFVAKDTKRPMLQGVLLSLKEGKLNIVSTDTVKMYINQIESGYEGEVSVIIRPETIPVLKAIFDANGEKPFPILVNDKALFISSKGLFLKATLFEGVYPDVVSVLENGKLKKLEYAGEITEEVIKKLKAIENKTSTLIIAKDEKEITFETKSEIDTNSFKIKEENEYVFQKKVNYSNFLNIVAIANSLEIRENFFMFTKGETKILLMTLREE